MAEAGRHRLWALDARGRAQVLAGHGRGGPVDGPALEAVLAQPSGLAVTADGALASSTPRPARCASSTGRPAACETLVGAGLFAWGAADGDARAARGCSTRSALAAAPDRRAVRRRHVQRPAARLARAHLWTVPVEGFAEPGGLDVLPDGRLVVADTGNHRVVLVDPAPTRRARSALDVGRPARSTSPGPRPARSPRRCRRGGVDAGRRRSTSTARGRRPRPRRRAAGRACAAVADRPRPAARPTASFALRCAARRVELALGAAAPGGSPSSCAPRPATQRCLPPAPHPARLRRHPHRLTAGREPPLEWTAHARAARGRDHRAPARRGAARRDDRVGARPRASTRSRRSTRRCTRSTGAADRGRAPDRQAPRHRRRRGDLVVLVHLMSRRAAAALRQARRRCATARRGCCCASTTGASCACASSAPSRRRGSRSCAPEALEADDARRHARPGGVARPAADLARAARRRRAAAALAAARPARDRRHRALVGRRDPVDGAAVAVQARRRPRRRRGRARCARRSSSALGGALDHYEEVVHAADPRQAAAAAAGPPPPGRAVPALRRRRIEAVHYEDYVMCYCPTGPDRRPRAQGPPAVAAAQVTRRKDPHDARSRPAAPDFTLPDQDGEPVTLSDLRGRTVVLYFYPKADTPGCTTQACGVRDHRPTTTAPARVVLGVSPDPVEAVKKFHDKQGLTSRCSPTRTTRSPRPTGSGWRSRCTAGRTGATHARRSSSTPTASSPTSSRRSSPKTHDEVVLQALDEAAAAA